jgi:hypothetical protein
MSQLTTGIFGAIAVFLTFGAAQFASGRDLSEAAENPAPVSLATNELATNEIAINRAAKTDRAAGVVGSSAQMRTISLRLDGFSDTSFLVRVSGADGAGGSSSAPSVAKSGDRKMTLACEPVVSILTEIAKRLQPGRCVT